MSYVVTGATGKVGSVVVDYLVSQLVPVRVVIRSEKKAALFKSQNVEVNIADLTNTEELTKALQGAKAVFAMNPPAYDKPDILVAATNVSHALATAIKAANVMRVVVLSSIGSQCSSKTGSILTTHILEEALKDSAPQVVMVRCAAFTENWLSAVSAIKLEHTSVIDSMFQKLDKKIPHIAINDIGRVIAEYMTKPTNEIDRLMIIELEGPEPFSPKDIATVTTVFLGKPVSAVAMTEETMQEFLNKTDWSKANQDTFMEMIKGYDDNIIDWTTDENIIRIKGTVSLNDVLEKVLT